MGKFKRIAMKDIKAMQKTLDDLPDKNLGKTRECATPDSIGYLGKRDLVGLRGNWWDG